ncbi:hypothetical protein BW730_14150 [Tessaracoccus aquimaris]|uniref:HTH tetR-type domain-containing protein n=1 Tax=Tessaracoccus aquimaris TaxID=1332264 RepID=A0A1Q2CTC3_9ACTN|nr:TetR family transcriptional regulator [Tessaracoccus aquimaris]AQP49381.1 hypothetical protein BW730_14150 [Tessaracoccus aquimaris]
MTDPDVDPPKGARPVGRRAGESGTREDILDAALTLFAERGFDGASMRAIADAAGVDPALIRHFFTDKPSLFAAAMAAHSEIPQRMAEAVSGDPGQLGRRVAEAYLTLWDDAELGPVLQGLVRSAVTSEHGGELVAEALFSQMSKVPEVAAAPPEATRGVALAGAHLMGVALARNVLGLSAFTGMSREELVEAVAPSIQRYLSPLVERRASNDDGPGA